ncbi:MAG: phosphatidylglycerophosphatase A [Ignavibacteriales bacterium]|nr:MAG: phosphatidylglycerophosphatase A [Ignavibacteriales bacterium]
MRHSFAVFICSWFYTSFLPPFWPFRKMAGTYGTFFSLPLCWLIFYFGGENTTVLWAVTSWIVFWIGIMFVANAEKDIGLRIDWKGKKKDRDQNEIVIDETLGILITCSPLVFMRVENIYLTLFVAFILFRIFDIVKFPPARTFDRMKNSFGVMMDDFVAGLYAALVLMICIDVFNM